MKTKSFLSDRHPEAEDKAKELLSERLDRIGSEITSTDDVYQELAKQTVKAGNELLSALDLPAEQARKLFDAYEMAVIKQDDYLLEKVYKQAFRDGIESYKALLKDTV